LYLVNFTGLLLDGQVAMHHPQPALLRHGNGQPRLGLRVHGRADHRDVERDVARKLGARVGLRRDHVRAPRQQQHVIKGQGLRDGKMDHEDLSRWEGIAIAYFTSEAEKRDSLFAIRSSIASPMAFSMTWAREGTETGGLRRADLAPGDLREVRGSA